MNKKYILISTAIILIITTVYLINSKSNNYYNNSLKKAQEVESIELLDIINTNNLSGYQYTIFDDKNNVYRSKNELAELSAALDQDIIELVALRPERLILYELITQVVTRIRVFNKDELLKNIDIFHKDIINSTAAANIIKNIENYRNKLNNNKYNYEQISKKLNIKSSDKSGYKPGKFVNNYKLRDVSKSVYIDNLYNKYAEDKIYLFITQYINKFLAEYPEKKIKYNPQQKSKTVLLTGGPGSGKSSVYRLIKQRIEYSNIDWQDVVKINLNDYFKLFLAPKEITNNKLNAQLIEPELRILQNRFINKRLKDLINNKQIQYLFLQQDSIDKTSLDLGLLNNGMVSVYVVTTDIKTSIVRSYNKALNTGNYNSVRHITDAHKKLISSLPGIIGQYAGKNIYFNVLDNNSENYSLIKIFEVFNMGKYVVILDKDRLNRFISKINSDQVAESYLGQYLKPLIEEGYRLEFV